MSWFRKKKKVQDRGTSLPLPENNKATVEIVAHKQATKDAVHQVQEANQYLREIFEDNDNFTIKIFLARGGKLPRRQKHS